MESWSHPQASAGQMKPCHNLLGFAMAVEFIAGGFGVSGYELDSLFHEEIFRCFRDVHAARCSKADYQQFGFGF